MPAENKFGDKFGLPNGFTPGFTPGDNSDSSSSYMGSEKFEQFDFGRDRKSSNPMDLSGTTGYNFQKSRQSMG